MVEKPWGAGRSGLEEDSPGWVRGSQWEVGRTEEAPGREVGRGVSRVRCTGS